MFPSARPYGSDQFNIRPVIWKLLLATTHYLTCHNVTKCSGALKRFAWIHNAEPETPFEMEIIDLFIKGSSVVFKPTKRDRPWITFKKATAFVFFCENVSSQSSHPNLGLLAHYCTLLFQFRCIMRYGKLTASRISERITNTDGSNPDDDRVRCCQVLLEGTPFTKYAYSRQTFFIDKLKSGIFSFRTEILFNTKTSKRKNKRRILLMPEEIIKPFCLPKFLGLLLESHLKPWMVLAHSHPLFSFRDSVSTTKPVTKCSYLAYFKQNIISSNLSTGNITPGSLKRICLSEI